MTTQELKRYIESVFDTELNIYVQEKTLNRMKNTYASLGTKKTIREPACQIANVNISSYMGSVGFVIGLVYGIITAIIEYNSSSGPIIKFINAVGTLFVNGIIGFIVGGLTIGTIVGLIIKSSKQKENDSKYNADMQRYRQNISDDEKRVKNELVQKKALGNEIQMMQTRLVDSKNNLKKMYSYGVLNPDYQNIYAVSSIYEYLAKGRTKSLVFDETTGDQGAYNIYEYERRMNMIITNTEEILNKLDDISTNQYELVNGLRNANNRIDSLCSGVSSFMKNTTNSLNSIEHSQSLIAYNTERTNRELEFLTWMHIFN